PDLAESITRCTRHRLLARKAGEKAAILLKNADHLLPLDINKIKSLAVIGPNAADIHLGGYNDEPRVGIDLLYGIQEFVGGKIKVEYAEGCRITEGYASWFADEVVQTDPVNNKKLIAEAVRVAQNVDVVILCVGDNEQTCREAWKTDHLGDRASLEMVGEQEELIHAIAGTGKPVIMVMNHGRPIALTSVLDSVHAILDIWYLGEETGRVVADILFGNVNPGGKLPITYPRSVGHLPVFYNKKPSANRGYLFEDNQPLFPFGFGLSYTSFQYSNLRLSSNTGAPGTRVMVMVDITNTGKRDGEEVVQLYIHDIVASVTRPVTELRDFKRIHLQAGECKTVTFDIPPEKLALLNENWKRVVEPGQFEMRVGGNSVDVLKAVYTVS
ncbi:MAG: beta-glucosidase, partial [Calditrichaeota bacterium]